MKVVFRSAIFLLLTFNIQGQESSLLNKTNQESSLDLYLRMDWKAIEKNKKEKVYREATFNLVSDHGDSIILPAKVKTRGNMRLELCSMPPLKIKLEKTALTAKGFSDMNEFDVVQPCHESKEYEQYLLREYLAYKLWELVSPYAFKVQLVQLHYPDPSGRDEHTVAFGFLIENIEEFVERTGGRRNKTPVISRNAVDRDPLLRMFLFEFMIGNTDWNIQNRHNLEFAVIPGHTFLVPVPYDFDYSGLVNAPYAAHPESLELTAITSRYYQGWCYSEEDVQKTLEMFRLRKDSILHLPYTIEGLDDKSKKWCSDYLSGFFEIIDNPRKLENQVIRHCDMWPKN